MTDSAQTYEHSIEDVLRHALDFHEWCAGHCTNGKPGHCWACKQETPAVPDCVGCEMERVGRELLGIVDRSHA